MQAEIGIVGGTGLYDPKLLKNAQEIEVKTPYGAPSDAFILGEMSGRCVAFLPRHGRKHTIRPTDVNSRANIFAFKKLGVERILAVSTVGSLKRSLSLAILCSLTSSLTELRVASSHSTLKAKCAIFQSPNQCAPK